ncbi:hypothetical protein OE88DRAFT_1659519, partial [Heliocybe sulcata]
MKNVFTSIIAFASLALAAPTTNGNLTIERPTDVVSCGVAVFHWTGGVAPYHLASAPGSSLPNSTTSRIRRSRLSLGRSMSHQASSYTVFLP